MRGMAFVKRGILLGKMSSERDTALDEPNPYLVHIDEGCENGSIASND